MPNFLNNPIPPAEADCDNTPTPLPSIDYELVCLDDGTGSISVGFAAHDQTALSPTVTLFLGGSDVTATHTIVQCASTGTDFEFVKNCFTDGTNRFTQAVAVDVNQTVLGEVWFDSSGAVVAPPVGVTPCEPEEQPDLVDCISSFSVQTVTGAPSQITDDGILDNIFGTSWEPCGTVTYGPYYQPISGVTDGNGTDEEVTFDIPTPVIPPGGYAELTNIFIHVNHNLPLTPPDTITWAAAVVEMASSQIYSGVTSSTTSLDAVPDPLVLGPEVAVVAGKRVVDGNVSWDISFDTPPEIATGSEYQLQFVLGDFEPDPFSFVIQEVVYTYNVYTPENVLRSQMVTVCQNQIDGLATDIVTGLQPAPLAVEMPHVKTMTAQQDLTTFLGSPVVSSLAVGPQSGAWEFSDDFGGSFSGPFTHWNSWSSGSERPLDVTAVVLRPANPGDVVVVSWEA